MQKTVDDRRKRIDPPKKRSKNKTKIEKLQYSFPALSLHANNRKPAVELHPQNFLPLSEYAKAETYLSQSLQTHKGNHQAAQNDFAKETATLRVLIKRMQRSPQESALNMASSSYYKTRFVQVLQHKLSNGIVRIYFRHWTKASEDMWHQWEKRAIVRIIRVFRNYRRRIIQQKNSKQHNIVSMHPIAQQLRDQCKQASRIQMCWRRSQFSKRVQQMVRRSRSAGTMQRWYRRLALHRAMRSSHATYLHRNQMAVVLQASFRGMRTRKILRINEKKEYAVKETMLLVLRHTSRRAMLHWEWTRNGAVYLIQTRLVKPFLTRRHHQRQREEKKVQKAISLLSRPLRRWVQISLANIRDAYSLHVYTALRKSDPSDFVRLPRSECEYLFLDLGRIALSKHWRVLHVQSTLLRRLHFEGLKHKVSDRLCTVYKQDKIDAEEWEAITLIVFLGAVRIQSNFRGWVQRLKYETSRMRKRKLARIDRQKRIQRLTNQIGSSATPYDIVRWELRDLKTGVEAARKIQRFFREYKAQIQARICAWKQMAISIEDKILRQRCSTMLIQANVRYFQARKTVKLLRAERMLRKKMRQRYYRKRKRIAIAIGRITRWTTWIIKWKQLRKDLHQRRVKDDAISRLQRWAHHRVSRILSFSSLALRDVDTFKPHLHSAIDSPILLSLARIQAERKLYCQQSLGICQEKVMNQLIIDPIIRSQNSSRRAFKKPFQTMNELELFMCKHRSFLLGDGLGPLPALTIDRSEGPSFPIIAMVFYYIAGNKDPTSWPGAQMPEYATPNTYQTERIDGTRLMTFLKKFHRVRSNTKKLKNSEAINAERALFSIPELDHAVTTLTGNTPNIDVHLFYEIICMLVEDNPSIKNQTVSSGTNHKSRIQCVRPYKGKEACVVAFFKIHLLHLPELSVFRHALNRYVIQYLESTAVRTIVSAFRRLRTKHRIANLRKLRQFLAHEKILASKAIILQKIARMFLARCVYKRKIQKLYWKYYDAQMDVSFWQNPITGYETWQKPGALGDEDVEREIIPGACRDEKLHMTCQSFNNETDTLNSCKKKATLFCYTCRICICSNCCQKMHEGWEEGEKLKESFHSFTTKVPTWHDIDRIVFCSICNLLAATRQCAECFDEELKESKRSSSRRGDGRRGSAHLSLYCDDCFRFIHRRGALQTHQFCYLSPFCDVCLNWDESQEQESNKSDELCCRIHTNTSLTNSVHSLRFANQTFAESSIQDSTCSAASAQYACTTCDNLKICTKCAKSKHPKELCGSLERLYPCTRREMNVTIQHRTRIDEAKRVNAMLEQKQRNSAKLIEQQRSQSAARKIYYFLKNSTQIALARQIRRKKQLAKDSLCRQKRIDAKIERHILYQLQHFFGVARPLPSDSRILQALRHLNAYQRRRLMIRARQFGLLVEEYIFHGIPLPGVVSCSVTQASSSVWLQTSEDLRGWVLPRQTLRLRPIYAAQKKDCPSAQDIVFKPAVLGRTWSEDQEAQDLLVCIDTKRKIHEKRIPIINSIVPFDYDGKKWIHSDELKDHAVQQEIVCHAFLVEFSLDSERHVWLAPVL